MSRSLTLIKDLCGVIILLVAMVWVLISDDWLRAIIVIAVLVMFIKYW